MIDETEKSFDEIAVFYDLLVKGLKGDKSFYVKETLKAKSVLELACGTGRIALPIARKGVNVVGVDISEGMLEKARIRAEKEGIKNVRFFNGDMRSFKLDQKFDLVIIPYNAFLHMLTLEDQKKCLKNIKNHLTGDGLLIFNVFIPDLKRISEKPRKKLTTQKKEPKTGDQLKLYEHSVYDTLNQLIHLTFTFERYRKKKLVKRKNIKLKLRYCFRDELLLLFENCGYKVVEVYGGFRKQRLTEKSKHMVWVLKHRNLSPLGDSLRLS